MLGTPLLVFYGFGVITFIGFIGFENLANMPEDACRPERSPPCAILISA